MAEPFRRRQVRIDDDPDVEGQPMEASCTHFPVKRLRLLRIAAASSWVAAGGLRTHCRGCLTLPEMEHTSGGEPNPFSDCLLYHFLSEGYRWSTLGWVGLEE